MSDTKRLARIAVTALVFLFLGAAGTAAVFAYLPDPGSPPSIFDDFNWDSTANGFWHVNAIGARAQVKDSFLTLKGHSVELDRRIQTDPRETVLVARMEGLQFHKFGMGIGVYHAGTMGIEFDDDGVKCGRGTDFGWKVEIMKSWTSPPAGQIVYLVLRVKNPYPSAKDYQRAAKVAGANKTKLKPVTLSCGMYDAQGRRLAYSVPRDPLPNAHYVSLDEAFLRTWDGGNNYRVDWFYAGPSAGNPVASLLK